MYMRSPFIFEAPRRASERVEAATAWLTKRCQALGRSASAAVLGALTLTACATSEPVGGPLTIEVAAPTPRAALQRIASGASKCWTSGEIANYAVIPELDTSAGTPRLLVFKKGAGGGLPELVIEGSSGPTKLRSYGPLASERLSNRINADIIRWSVGVLDCRGRA